MGTVTAIRVTAAVDRTDTLVRDARYAAENDTSWREWVERYEQGSASVAQLETVAEFEVDGERGEVVVVNEGVWLEHKPHLPQVLEQIREIAYKDVFPLTTKLGQRGIDVTPEDLEQMFVEVHVDERLRAAVLQSISADADAGTQTAGGTPSAVD